MTETRKAWGDSFIKWREFVPIFISMIVVGGSLFGYVLKLHAESPHAGVATSERVTRSEIRHAERLERIESKIDKLIDDIHRRSHP